MSTQSNSSGYMHLFQGNDWHKGLSAEQMQMVSDQWMAWFKKLADQGKVVTGSPLDSERMLVSRKGGRIVADGPFAESKEAIGGYFLLNVSDMEEAVSIAKECPGLAYGSQVEVRHVANECPLAEKARTEANLTPAMA